MYLSGCQTTGDGVKSRSIGAPGELLVVMDNNLQKTKVKRMINAFANEEFPCVPQFESTFKLTTLSPNDFEGHFKAYRNIVIVKQIASEKADISFRKDVWAGYQQVVQINFSEEDSFVEIFKRNQKKLFDFLYYGDIKSMQQANRNGADEGARHLIDEKFSVDMVIPQGYRLVKDTADFCWYRFDKLETNLHVIVKSFELDSIESLQDEVLIQLRDSVGKTFIPGPSELTFMQTEKRLPVLSKKIKVNGMDVIELRGLWKVDGFFMGGSFVNYFIKDDVNKKMLMVEGFVYAPRKQNKAYYVRQIESILHSVKL